MNLFKIKDLLKELFIKSEILIDYFDMMNNFEVKLNTFKESEFANDYKNMKKNAEEKEKNLKEEISFFFNEIHYLIKERESQLISEINSNFEDNVHKKISHFENNVDVLKINVNNWKTE